MGYSAPTGKIIILTFTFHNSVSQRSDSHLFLRCKALFKRQLLLGEPPARLSSWDRCVWQPEVSPGPVSHHQCVWQEAHSLTRWVQVSAPNWFPMTGSTPGTLHTCDWRHTWRKHTCCSCQSGWEETVGRPGGPTRGAEKKKESGKSYSKFREIQRCA